jgi:glycosyltransferase involved in cell wall biosynthesis
MRICFLGEYSGNLDEGMRNVSFEAADRLAKEHVVKTLDIRNLSSYALWKEAREFKPDIIQYMHGPSDLTFVFLKIFSIYCGNVKTVIYAMHPGFTGLSKVLIPLLKPTLILVQSQENEDAYKKLGCPTEFLPCGVDTERFKPISLAEKSTLREKYGLPRDKFIILHVGSVKSGRNVQALEKLQDENDQVVIVGAVSPGTEEGMAERLGKAGIILKVEYFKNIEEVYALSDCYIFPVPPENKINAIDTPLSVLEAMSCNLPVIATRFGALPRMLKPGDGLHFAVTEDDYKKDLEVIKKNRTETKTREQIMQYSWTEIITKLNKVYTGLVKKQK